MRNMLTGESIKYSYTGFAMLAHGKRRAVPLFLLFSLKTFTTLWSDFSSLPYMGGTSLASVKLLLV